LFCYYYGLVIASSHANFADLLELERIAVGMHNHVLHSKAESEKLILRAIFCSKIISTGFFWICKILLVLECVSRKKILMLFHLFGLYKNKCRKLKKWREREFDGRYTWFSLRDFVHKNEFSTLNKNYNLKFQQNQDATVNSSNSVRFHTCANLYNNTNLLALVSQQLENNTTLLKWFTLFSHFYLISQSLQFYVQFKNFIPVEEGVFNGGVWFDHVLEVVARVGTKHHLQKVME